ncbi:hypothetical protein VCUG_02248 [Vavraia culicis subsp. floridensis]|uniref:Uncharacterized protein n=1 Tax=Vavraia culicis (isolate floridensis) TaxID=948595 RepID=L2GRJ9_VAVCU|nr:uncharacterized protein VCUG_02248 [Vavraia culicis subsp. floridensis]ELA46281.1 hypothetical protein VCUG_02248 [Vavraia culicis subsp. floridensis]
MIVSSIDDSDFSLGDLSAPFNISTDQSSYYGINYAGSYDSRNKSDAESGNFKYRRLLAILFFAGFLVFITGIIGLYITLRLYLRRKTKMFVNYLASDEMGEVAARYVDEGAKSSLVIMFSCTVNDEDCLFVIPLHQYSSELFEIYIRMPKEMIDRPYFYKLFWSTMLSYSKDQNNFLYIPYSNLKRKSVLPVKHLKAIYNFTGIIRNDLIYTANEFINIILNPLIFTYMNEIFTICIIDESYVDAVVYSCTDEQLVLNFSESFYFPEKMAARCFSHIIHTFTEKLKGGEIDELSKTADFCDSKVRMSFENEKNE